MSQQKIDIISNLNPQYFWDTDLYKLDAFRSRRLIIERIYSLGTLNEMRLVMDYYGKPVVEAVLINLNYLDPKSCNFAALILNIPPSSFKCYKRTHSNPPPWNS